MKLTIQSREAGQWLLLIALPVILFVAYLPAIRGGFIWDDDRHVTANQNLTDLQGLKNIWLNPLSEPQYYPMTHTSFWLEYQLWGADPLGYHIDNVMLHLASAFFIWRILLREQTVGIRSDEKRQSNPLKVEQEIFRR